MKFSDQHNTLFNSTVSTIPSNLPSDYVAVPASLSFPPSSDFQSINFTAPIISDDINEATEAFFVQILFAFENENDSDIFSPAIMLDGFALIRIANDDRESQVISVVVTSKM